MGEDNGAERSKPRDQPSSGVKEVLSAWTLAAAVFVVFGLASVHFRHAPTLAGWLNAPYWNLGSDSASARGEEDDAAIRCLNCQPDNGEAATALPDPTSGRCGAANCTVPSF
jgi:hypothetical protein